MADGTGAEPSVPKKADRVLQVVYGFFPFFVVKGVVCGSIGFSPQEFRVWSDEQFRLLAGGPWVVLSGAIGSQIWVISKAILVITSILGTLNHKP